MNHGSFEKEAGSGGKGPDENVRALIIFEGREFGRVAMKKGLE